MVTVADLQPLDILLYRPVNVFGKLIEEKTWHKVSHCEGYIGNGQSVASRDGLGVNEYPVRLDGLGYVLRLRPGVVSDLAAAMAWFTANAKGKPYAWRDLENFANIPVHTDAYFCSEFLTAFLRAAKVPVFNAEPPEKIAPFEFLLTEFYAVQWTDGKDAAV